MFGYMGAVCVLGYYFAAASIGLMKRVAYFLEI